jgi:hypothetical protein
MILKCSRPGRRIEYPAPETPSLPLLSPLHSPFSFVASNLAHLVSTWRLRRSETHPIPSAAALSVPPVIQSFLKSPLVEASDTPFILLAHPPTVLSCLTLREHVGRVRTSSVWRADINTGGHMRFVAKMITALEIASIVRETLFYQNVFPQSALALALFAPKYCGTYASCELGM